MAEIITTYSFHQAQTDIITSVETQFGSDAVFLSTSMDCEALLWDIRKTKPAIG
jgi:methylosome protein 50